MAVPSIIRNGLKTFMRHTGMYLSTYLMESFVVGTYATIKLKIMVIICNIKHLTAILQSCTIRFQVMYLWRERERGRFQWVWYTDASFKLLNQFEDFASYLTKKKKIRHTSSSVRQHSHNNMAIPPCISTGNTEINLRVTLAVSTFINI